MLSVKIESLVYLRRRILKIWAQKLKGHKCKQVEKQSSTTWWSWPIVSQRNKILQVYIRTVNRDLFILRYQAKNIKKYIDERLPAEYEKYLERSNVILKEAWTSIVLFIAIFHYITRKLSPWSRINYSWQPKWT